MFTQTGGFLHFRRFFPGCRPPRAPLHVLDFQARFGKSAPVSGFNWWHRIILAKLAGGGTYGEAAGGGRHQAGGRCSI